MTLTEYIALPWTIRGRAIRDAAGEPAYYVVSIDELPGFSVVGDTRVEALAELELGLRVYLEGVLAAGFPPALTQPGLLASEVANREALQASLAVPARGS
jgi:predicted RNase H-like HicB family nuclease